MGRFTGLKTELSLQHGLAGAALAVFFLVSNAAEASTHHKKPSGTESKATAPGECKPTPEQASIGIRALQTELMVAGLKCSADQWNSFTAKFKSTIKADADRLQALFRKTYGKGGASQMNTFVTLLANDASQRSNGSAEVDYCRQEDVLFHKVLALTGAELERFSVHRSLTVPTPVALCPPEADTPAATTAAASASSTATAVNLH